MAHLILLVFLGGGIGSLLRFLCSRALGTMVHGSFPLGTLVVNFLGCFFIELFLTLSEKRSLMPPEWRAFVTIGILGGFTTFSSFVAESYELLREGSFFLGAWNIVLTFSLTFAGAFMGHRLGEFFG